MSEYGGLWKHKNNQHALVPPKTECGCSSGGGIKNCHILYPSYGGTQKNKNKQKWIWFWTLMALILCRFDDELNQWFFFSSNFVKAFIDFPKPLIALVNGPAVGVSVTVLGLFDAVYCSDRVGDGMLCIPPPLPFQPPTHTTASPLSVGSLSFVDVVYCTDREGDGIFMLISPLPNCPLSNLSWRHTSFQSF